MPVNFAEIKIGSEWTRNQLAKLWGYKRFNAIARGVITPANENKIILFVTEEKQQSLTQYNDHLSNGILKWEGEDGHGNDQRIATASENGDSIYVFYRKRHHQVFTYIGLVVLESKQIFSDRPSEFKFALTQ
jgi:hypothetical protein